MSVIKCIHGMYDAWCSLCHPATGNAELSISNFESDNRTETIENLADSFVNMLSEDKHHALLCTLVANEFSRARRNRMRAIETASTIETSEYNASTVLEYRDCPWNAPRKSSIARQWHRLTLLEQKRIRVEKDERFAKYVQTKNIHPGRPVDETEFATWVAENAFAEYKADVEAKVTLKVTAELLAAEFTTSNGQTVTWAAATANDHVYRINYLLSHAKGSVSTAKRHQAALALLEENQIKSLGEMVCGVKK